MNLEHEISVAKEAAAKSLFQGYSEETVVDDAIQSIVSYGALPTLRVVIDTPSLCHYYSESGPGESPLDALRSNIAEMISNTMWEFIHEWNNIHRDVQLEIWYGYDYLGEWLNLTNEQFREKESVIDSVLFPIVEKEFDHEITYLNWDVSVMYCDGDLDVTTTSPRDDNSREVVYEMGDELENRACKAYADAEDAIKKALEGEI